MGEYSSCIDNSLRFGDHVHAQLLAEQRMWEQGAGYLERETFNTFFKLPVAQRTLIRKIILTFAKVHTNIDKVVD